jgi:hypothetical protein
MSQNDFLWRKRCSVYIAYLLNRLDGAILLTVMAVSPVHPAAGSGSRGGFICPNGEPGGTASSSHSAAAGPARPADCALS